MRKRGDLLRLVQQGTRYHVKQYTLVVARNGLDSVRIAASVKRKIGNAALRNHEKRIVRECFRREKKNLPNGFDLLVIIKKATEDFASSYRTLKGLFQRSLT